MICFRTCIPKHLPLSKAQVKVSSLLLKQAKKTVQDYAEKLHQIPFPEQTLSVLIVQEALYSLQSQKIKVSIKKILLASFLRSRKHNPQLSQIFDYQKALLQAFVWIKRRHLSSALMKKIHAIVKKGAPRELGRFRKKQNWIGKEGCPIEEAYFYPPKATLVPKYMHNLECYGKLKEEALQQLAIFFAQLLIIHPFMDGNGRVARIIIPLFLYKKAVLPFPLFFLSRYFKMNRIQYFKKLFAISENGDWQGWIRFFLKGIIQEGAQGIKKMERLEKLYQTVNALLLLETGKKNADKICRFFFQHPFFTEEHFCKKLKISNALAKRLLKKLQQSEILKNEEGKELVFWRFEIWHV